MTSQPLELTETIRAVTPCCGRALKPFPFMVHATEVRTRTCPACRQQYRVIIKPLGKIPGGHLHECTWVPTRHVPRP